MKFLRRPLFILVCRERESFNELMRTASLPVGLAFLGGDEQSELKEREKIVGVGLRGVWCTALQYMRRDIAKHVNIKINSVPNTVP